MVFLPHELVQDLFLLQEVQKLLHVCLRVGYGSFLQLQRYGHQLLRKVYTGLYLLEQVAVIEPAARCNGRDDIIEEIHDVDPQVEILHPAFYRLTGDLYPRQVEALVLKPESASEIPEKLLILEPVHLQVIIQLPHFGIVEIIGNEAVVIIQCLRYFLWIVHNTLFFRVNNQYLPSVPFDVAVRKDQLLMKDTGEIDEIVDLLIQGQLLTEIELINKGEKTFA